MYCDAGFAAINLVGKRFTVKILPRENSDNVSFRLGGFSRLRKGGGGGVGWGNSPLFSSYLSVFFL